MWTHVGLPVIKGWVGSLKVPKRPTVTLYHNVYTKAVTNGENTKDHFTHLINRQIFIRLFPKWTISLNQYGSKHYSKTKEGIWKGSCKVKSATHVPVLFWSALWYWLLGCSIEVGFIETQSQVLSTPFLSLNLHINHLLNMLSFSFTVGPVPSIPFSLLLFSFNRPSPLAIGKPLLRARHCVKSYVHFLL